MTAYTTATEVVDSAIPASQLASWLQSSQNQVTAVQPKKGTRKLISPTAVASFHFALKIAGSNSAPARKVSRMAPVPDRNLIQGSCVPSIAAPTEAPISSWATVPTTISDSAVAILSQIESSVAINAKPSQSAASV